MSVLKSSSSPPGDRVIDVGSEWRTFTNEKATKDPSRVGDAQNPLLNGGDLTTMIGKVRTPEKTSVYYIAVIHTSFTNTLLKTPSYGNLF